MTKEEMLKGLLDNETVRESIMTMSQHGNLSEENVASAIADYFQVCSVFCRRLYEMEIHKKCPMGPENAHVPFVIIGQPGIVPGAADDMAIYLHSELEGTPAAIEEHVKQCILEGDSGQPNLIHGIMNIDCVGNYLEQLKIAQMVAALDFDEAQIDLGEVPDIFAGKVH